MAKLTVSTGSQTDDTLLGVLRRKNPGIIDRWEGKSYKNTKSSSGIFDIVNLNDIHPNIVQPWKDFTYEAIHLAYGDILDEKISIFRRSVPELSDYHLVGNLPRTPTIIANENDVDTLGIVWSCNIMRGPIKAAASMLRPRMSSATQWSVTLAAKKVAWAHADPKKSGVSLSPDWVIMDHEVVKKYPEDKQDQPSKPLVYAIGDSKLKQKWKSSWLSLPEDKMELIPMDLSWRAEKPVHRTMKKERIRPLEQVATYCRYALTRYAYVVTQTEVVVMRVRRIQTSNKTDHYAAIEYQSIPWVSTAKDGLTAHLAIWALGCMGMNDAHRPMEGNGHVPLEKMARLTWWRHDTMNGYYENAISKRKIYNKDWKPEWEEFVELQDGPGNSYTKDFDTGSRPNSAGSGAGSGSGTVDSLSKKMGAASLDSKDPGGASSGSSGQPTMTFTKCKFNKVTYPITENQKRYYICLDKKTWTVIDKDKNGHYTIKHNSKVYPVEMLR